MYISRFWSCGGPHAGQRASLSPTEHYDYIQYDNIVYYCIHNIILLT